MLVREIRPVPSGGFLSARCHPNFPELCRKAASAAVSEENHVFEPLIISDGKSTPGEVQPKSTLGAETPLYLQVSLRSKAWENHKIRRYLSWKEPTRIIESQSSIGAHDILCSFLKPAIW